MQEEYVTLLNDVKINRSDYIGHDSFFIYHGKCIFHLVKKEEYDRNKIVIIDSKKYVVIASARLFLKIGGTPDSYRAKGLVFLDDCPDFEFLRPAEKSSTEKYDEEELAIQNLSRT